MGNAICTPLSRSEDYEHEDDSSFPHKVSSDSISPSSRNEARTTTVKTQLAISTCIDNSLRKEKYEHKKRLKILLLGGADAGKSTIFKQMRILHMSGFSEAEMLSFYNYLRFNLYEIFHEIALRVQESVVTASENERLVINLFAEGMSGFTGINEEIETKNLLAFLELKCVQSFMELYANYASLPDNAHYYLPKIATLLAPNHIPTAEDVLHLRIPTTGVREINFTFSSNSIRYESLDGVDIDPKPVLHRDLFAPVEQAVIRVNRLKHSVKLFGDMLRCRSLRSSSFILFLNKTDLFAKKLPLSPLGDHFSGYNGKSNQQAMEFLKDQFIQRKSKRDTDRSIYSHYTCATDTKNVEFVFTAACDIIIQRNLLTSGAQ